MNPRIIERFTPLARELATTNHRPARHVSMIFLRGRIVSVGMNLKDVTHPFAAKQNYLFDALHSEADAYLKLHHKLRQSPKLVLLNFHWSNRLELKMSRPCRLCMPWCYEIFHRIWYSTGNGTEFARIP